MEKGPCSEEPLLNKGHGYPPGLMPNDGASESSRGQRIPRNKGSSYGDQHQNHCTVSRAERGTRSHCFIMKWTGKGKLGNF